MNEVAGISGLPESMANICLDEQLAHHATVPDAENGKLWKFIGTEEDYPVVTNQSLSPALIIAQTEAYDSNAIETYFHSGILTLEYKIYVQFQAYEGGELRRDMKQILNRLFRRFFESLNDNSVAELAAEIPYGFPYKRYQYYPVQQTNVVPRRITNGINRGWVAFSIPVKFYFSNRPNAF